MPASILLGRVQVSCCPAQTTAAHLRSAEDLDREDERVTLFDPSAGLTVGVAVSRGHCDSDGGPDLLSCNGFLKTCHDTAERELSRSAPTVAAVEYSAVTPIDSHITD